VSEYRKPVQIVNEDWWPVQASSSMPCGEKEPLVPIHPECSGCRDVIRQRVQRVIAERGCVSCGHAIGDHAPVAGRPERQRATPGHTDPVMCESKGCGCKTSREYCRHTSDIAIA
jgi:hypothetical protein